MDVTLNSADEVLAAVREHVITEDEARAILGVDSKLAAAGLSRLNETAALLGQARRLVAMLEAQLSAEERRQGRT